MACTLPGGSCRRLIKVFPDQVSGTESSGDYSIHAAIQVVSSASGLGLVYII